MPTPTRSRWILPAVLLVALRTALAADPAAAPLPAADPRGAFVVDHNFDMQRLVLDLELDVPNRSVKGTATWTVKRLASGDLRLDAVAFRELAAEVDGKPAPVTPGVREFTIGMPPDAAGADSTHTVVVHYAASPQLGLHWRGPTPAGESPDTHGEVYSQGELEDNRYWFPSYDHPDDRFAYEGHFTLAGHPKGWTIVTNPTEDLPSYLVMVAAAPYEVVPGPANAVALRAVVPPATPESWVRPVLDPLPDMLSHFTARTGVPYAWGHYDQTFVQRFIYGGMENTGSTIMHRRLLSAPSVQATRPWIPSIVAHELAHQWFGDLLTARTAREMWLNEGFATFFAADWEVHARRVAEGEAAADALAAAQVDGWRRSSLDPGGLAGRWFQGGGGATHAGAALGEANHNVYNKGAIVLTSLRVYLGEDAFWGGIRDYTRGHAHQSVDTLDLQRAMEARSGRDLAWFFEQWTELPSVPKLTTSWSWAAESAAPSGGTLSVTLRQEPAKGHAPGHPYTLPVDLSVDGGPPTRAWLTGESLTVTMPLAKAPGFVAIDPRGGLLVDWDQTQAPEAWSAQLKGGSPYSRLLALRALADMAPPADDPLPALFLAPSTPQPLREALADALGTRRTCDPLLPAAESDPDDRVRLAAASALGKCTDRAVAPRLLKRLAAEPNGDVRAALLRSASALDPAGALTTARKTLGRSDALENERSTAAGAIALAGAPSDIPALLRPGTDRDLRLASLRAAITLVQQQPLGPARDRLRASVARSAERLLSDLDLRGIQSGISALRDVGDPQSAALLEAFARRTTLPDLATSARDASAAIGARVDTVAPPTPNEAAARLKALEERLKALEDAALIEKR